MTSAMAEGKWVEAEEDESAESIAYRNGLFVETLWNHEENAALRESRTTPHVLEPGDRVFVPAIVPKQVPVATGAKHVFRRRGVPSKLLLVLHHYGGEALANLPFRLELPDRVVTGNTNGDGNLELPVMPDAGDAKLIIDPEGRNLVLALGFRRLRPIATTAGIQQRLLNLGYYRGAVDGLYGQLTIRAVQQFQLRHELATTGSVDDATRHAIARAHGC